MNFNWVDVLIVGIMLLGLVYGIVKGFIGQTFLLVGVVLGIVLSTRNYSVLGKLIGEKIQNPNISNILGFVLIFIVIVIIFVILGKILEKSLKAMKLGWINSIGGMLLGLFGSGIAIGTLLVIFMKYPLFGVDAVITKSKLSPFFLKFVKSLWKLLSPELIQFTKELLEKLKGLTGS